MFMRFSKYSSKQSAGFTLLELVLVLFLIGLLASAGLLFTENVESQAQFDETKRRMEIIRKAIIQTGERTVNGQPELSGFVVDNGRLPYCLKELTGPEVSFIVSSSSDEHYQSPCNNNTNLLIQRPGTTDEGMRYGWWGPYIQVTPDSDGERPFRDGYNNDDLTVNYGWLWTLSESVSGVGIMPVDLTVYDPAVDTLPRPYQLTVQSSGFDLTDPSGLIPEDISATLITENDWLIGNEFRLRFVNTSAVSAMSQSGGDYNWSEMQWSFTVSVSGKSSLVYENSDFTFTPPSSSIAKNAFYEHTVAVSAASMMGTKLPVGNYLVNLNCTDSGDDDCPVIMDEPYTIKLLPKHTIGPIRWNLLRNEP